MAEDLIVLNMCNAALTQVGVQLIRSLGDQSSAGFAVRANFDTSYHRALTRVPWGFARKEAELEESATEDTLTYYFPGTYLYDKPADFKQLWTWAGGITPRDASVVGDLIRSCTYPPLPITYVRAVPAAEAHAANQSFVEIVQVLLARAIKPRFSKVQVSADALSQRELDTTADMLIKEARVVEQAQLPRPQKLLATEVGRHRYALQQSRSRYRY